MYTFNETFEITGFFTIVYQMIGDSPDSMHFKLWPNDVVLSRAAPLSPSESCWDLPCTQQQSYGKLFIVIHSLSQKNSPQIYLQSTRSCRWSAASSTPIHEYITRLIWLPTFTDQLGKENAHPNSFTTEGAWFMTPWLRVPHGPRGPACAACDRRKSICRERRTPDWDLGMEGCSWLVVWNIFDFSIYCEVHHPNWLIFFGGVETTNQVVILVIWSQWFRDHPMSCVINPGWQLMFCLGECRLEPMKTASGSQLDSKSLHTASDWEIHEDVVQVWGGILQT